jgi:hypothetical protein
MKKIIFMLATSLLVLTGCHQFGGGVRVGHDHHAGKLPPAHAPAHGRRAQYRYHYYPDARFYFDVGRNVYFYLDSRGHWSVSASLPHHLRGYLHGHHVEIEMDIDKPYIKHKHHKSKYPPGQMKKKYKNKKKHKGNKHNEDDDERWNNGKRPYRY